MWLLDANLDVKLVEVLAGFGITASTTAARGWRELSNGNLVAAAVGVGFTCILRRDGLFGESAARALVKHPPVAVVVVRLPQMRRALFLDTFRAAWAAAPIAPVAGQLVVWPVEDATGSGARP